MDFVIVLLWVVALISTLMFQQELPWWLGAIMASIIVFDKVELMKLKKKWF